MENREDNLESTAVKTVAAVSKTPFRTAFMATLGVAAAQALVFFGFVASLIAIGLLVKKLF
jgi:hypothetical protein